VDLRRLQITDMEAANETTTLTGRTLDRLVAQNDELLARLDGGAGQPSFAAAYAFRALSAVPEGSSVVVVGATDSAVDRSLAALGYDVTTEHGLRTAHHEGEFDAALYLSRTIDSDQLRLLRHLTKAGGTLVLSAAVGPRPLTEARPVFDQDALDDLLEGWQLEDVTLIQRRDSTSWSRIDGPIADLSPTGETVAMVTATKRPL
jgi:hypothetical protein